MSNKPGTLTYISEDGEEFTASLPGSFGLHCSKIDDVNSCGDFARCIHKAIADIRKDHCVKKITNAITTGNHDGEPFFRGMLRSYSGLCGGNIATAIDTINCPIELIRLQKLMIAVEESAKRLSEFMYVEPSYGGLYGDSIDLRNDIITMRKSMHKLIESHNNAFSRECAIDCECCVPTIAIHK